MPAKRQPRNVIDGDSETSELNYEIRCRRCHSSNLELRRVVSVHLRGVHGQRCPCPIRRPSGSIDLVDIDTTHDTRQRRHMKLAAKVLAVATLAVGLGIGTGSAAHAANLAPTVPALSPSNDGYIEIGSPNLRATSRDPEGGPVSTKFTLGIYGGAMLAESGWLPTDPQRGAIWTVPTSSIHAGNISSRRHRDQETAEDRGTRLRFRRRRDVPPTRCRLFRQRQRCCRALRHR
jgi:hypothetical protein